MPPLPSTFDEETLQLIAAAQRHEKDLTEFQIPRLRSCRGPLSLQQDLAAELRDDIDTFARQIETLDVLVDDQNGSKNRRELKAIVDDFNENLANLRRESRTALLESKRTIDSLSKSNREELLSSSAVSEKRNSNNEKVTDDALMAASDNVTEALQRTMALMEGELKRSVLSAQMLADSTATLRSTSSTHDTLTGVMDTSKQLITALEKSDWVDRVLIFSALLFFILVVLFILKQRIFDRGIRMALWWTRFVPDFSGDSELLSMEKGSAAVLSTTLASSIASAASVLASSSAVEPTPLPEPTLETLLDVISDTDAVDAATPPSPTPEQTVHVEL
ncbi:Protein transport protein sec20 [Mycena sanguinolenta]|uniref:Protein transport protein sec20 n=1 Tax=Mycena sanguinolenta TaxID=230812 RepID=A0A8H6XP29_9AGAR|nr:Protein transport protein sec20 [Mycena sanguinolenta]